MQAEFRRVQQDDIVQQFRGQVEQGGQGEEPQGAVGGAVGTDGLVCPFGAPAEADFAVAFYEVKAVEVREYAGNLAADEFVPLGVILL